MHLVAQLSACFRRSLPGAQRGSRARVVEWRSRRSVSTRSAPHLVAFTLLALAACGKTPSPGPITCDTSADCGAQGTNFTCNNGRCVQAGDPRSGAGGEAGAAATECDTHEDCIDDHGDNPWLCRDHSCVSLTEPSQCPLVIGAGEHLRVLREHDPVVLGAYLPMDLQVPRDSAALTIELAIDELNQVIIDSGLGHPYVAVVCQALRPTLTVSHEHLVNHLGIRAVLAALDSQRLLEAFERARSSQDVFFLSPLGADPALTSLDDAGRMWHMLGPAADLAPAYVPLMERTERLVRVRLAEEGDDADAPLRVALVETNRPYLNPLTERVFAELQFNGVSASQNEDDGNFLRVRMASEQDTAFPDGDAVLTELAGFVPHIVVSLGGAEVSRLVVAPLDWWWTTLTGSTFPPFFLLGPSNLGNQGILGAGSTIAGSLQDRAAGVYYASPADSTLFDDFLERLSLVHDLRNGLITTASYYDAAYFLMYAFRAAHATHPTGGDIAKAMQRLVAGSKRLDLGPKDADEILAVLADGTDVQLALRGTLGHADFSTATGTRPATPSVYCLSPTGEPNFVLDAFRYDPDSGALVGVPDCVPDL